MRSVFYFLFLALLSTGCIPRATASDSDDVLLSFVPTSGASGEIKVWGSPEDEALLKDWEAGFRKFHPDARITATLHGPDSTMAGVYTGVADVAFMTREMKEPVERMAFAWVYHYPPFRVQIANGGLMSNRPSAALAVFVNRANPLAQLTLAQLDAVLGAEHRRGQSNIRFWGDLGLADAWADRPIHVYGPVVDSVPALYIRHVVLKDSSKWNADYREGDADGTDAIAALNTDSQGIAVAPLSAANDTVKPLALAATNGGPFIAPSHESVINHTYSLSRQVAMVVNRPKGKPIEPKVKEFLRYVLSRQGQAAIARGDAYLPLDRVSVERELQALE